MSNVEIPVNQLDRGLGLCAENIRRFIEDVDLLLEHSSTLHATALAIFASEELAKYSELRKAKQSATGQTASVDARLFRSHQHKQELARALIPKDALILSPAAFDAEAFDSRDFQTEDVEVSPALRLDCVFVDWQDGEWAYGSTVEVDRLKQFTQAILGVLKALESGAP
jgi:AbiV family abortive infection protein